MREAMTALQEDVGNDSAPSQLFTGILPVISEELSSRTSLINPDLVHTTICAASAVLFAGDAVRRVISKKESEHFVRKIGIDVAGVLFSVGEAVRPHVMHWTEAKLRERADRQKVVFGGI